jgi:subtilisin-like proprotein convertase family protein
VNITHTFTNDLRLTLISPTGTRVTLFDRQGGSGDNLSATIFDDEAATPISGGSAPFNGSFQPVAPLTAVDGQAPNGTWKLEVSDLAGGDIGTLTEWAVIVSTREPSVMTNALGNGALDLPDGSQTVRMTPLTGWVFTNPSDGEHTVTAAGAPLFDQQFGTMQVPAPSLTQVLVNGTTTPTPTVTFSRATSLQLTFNTAVTVQAGAFSLTNGIDTITSDAGGAIVVAGAGTNTLTLTFTVTAGVEHGSLAGGIWTLTTDLTKVRNVLDVAGSGSATTNNIRRLFGDADSNGTVDLTDFSALGNTFGRSSGESGWNWALDFDANNTIDLTDYVAFGNRFGQTL